MNVTAKIDEIISDGACIVGMGNYYKSDDAVGLYIVDHLKNVVESEDYRIINVEDVIESYVFKIADFECRSVLIIDAVEADASAGSLVFGRISDMDELIGSCSTHKLSLKLSGKVLEEYKKETYLLGIVVDNADFGVGLSDEVKKSADTIKDLLLKSINCSLKGVCQ
jgi:hydrogenase 3 maturation protease